MKPCLEPYPHHSDRKIGKGCRSLQVTQASTIKAQQESQNAHFQMSASPKYSISKFESCSLNNTQKESQSIKCLCQKVRKFSNQLSKFLPLETRKNEQSKTQSKQKDGKSKDNSRNLQGKKSNKVEKQQKRLNKTKS